MKIAFTLIALAVASVAAATPAGYVDGPRQHIPAPAGMTTQSPYENPWIPIEWGGDIQIQSGECHGVLVDRDPSGVLYSAASSDSYGVDIFKSTNGGQAWNSTGLGLYWPGNPIAAFGFDVATGSDSTFVYLFVVFNNSQLWMGRYDTAFTGSTVLGVDLSGAPKHYVVAGSNDDYDVVSPAVFVAYSQDAGGFADSTEIVWMNSNDYGATWPATPIVVASRANGDWAWVFDWCRGRTAPGAENIFFACSRMAGADTEVFFDDWWGIPVSTQITSNSVSDIYPNIAATVYGGDTCRIYIAYSRGTTDLGIAGYYTQDFTGGWTYAGYIADSTGENDIYPDVTCDPNYDNFFTFAYITLSPYYTANTFWGNFPGPFTYDGSVSGIHQPTGGLRATTPVHTGVTPIFNSSYVAWVGFAANNAWFDWWGNTTDVPGGPATLPVEVALHPAAPNPFNPATTLSFDLPSQMVVRLDVFDVLGRRVATLVNGEMGAGSHEVRWDATGVASGVYFARLSTDRGEATTKMTLLK